MISSDPLGPGSKDPTDSSGGGAGDELEAHFNAFFKSMKTGDRKAAASAMKSFVKACYEREDDEAEAPSATMQGVPGPY